MKFSVSLCVYLGNTIQEYIRCLRSILSNTILPNEIVVFVDGPLSFSIEQAHKLIPDTIEIKVVKSDINVGHGLARKNSVENCRNELISIVDVDDFCVKDRFERQINIFINRPEIDIVGGAILEINSKGEVFEKILPIAHKDIVDLMKWRCPLNQMTVMFRKSVYDDAGGYVHFYHNEDYYLWYRLMINGANFCNLKEVLMHCHIDDSYFSSSMRSPAATVTIARFVAARRPHPDRVRTRLPSRLLVFTPVTFTPNTCSTASLIWVLLASGATMNVYLFSSSKP